MDLQTSYRMGRSPLDLIIAEEARGYRVPLGEREPRTKPLDPEASRCYDMYVAARRANPHLQWD